MADDGHHSKTEAPTPRRREEARKKGQFAQSADLNSGLLILTGTLTLWLGGSWFAGQLLRMMQSALLTVGQTEWTFEQTPALAFSAMAQLVQITSPLFILLFGVGLVAGGLQSGFRVTTKPLAADWERLSPVKGWSRLFSSRSVMRGAMSIVKVTLFSLVVWWIVRGQCQRMSITSHG